MILQGGAERRLDELTPKGYQPIIHLTITDDYPLAQAFVVIEARKI
jgi:holo-[acyl-carrier protein] synthase